MALFGRRRRELTEVGGSEADVGVGAVRSDVKVQERLRPELKVRVVVPDVAKSFDCTKGSDEIVMGHCRAVALAAWFPNRAR